MKSAEPVEKVELSNSINFAGLKIYKLQTT